MEEPEVYLARDVLDKELVDKDGHKIGKVDDIVLDLRGDEAPRVRCIQSGRGTLAAHLGHTVQRISCWLQRVALGPEDQAGPDFVDWKHVTQIDVVVHLDLDREASGLKSTEDAIWNRWIRHIPWAER
ncbi:MAG TPA: hypothetical protein DEV93_11410 [Chloroflexi bacterium]|nr:hypothetical protein [Chloroflexota bacterium]